MLIWDLQAIVDPHRFTHQSDFIVEVFLIPHAPLSFAFDDHEMSISACPSKSTMIRENGRWRRYSDGRNLLLQV
ncbi:hypothetical protein ABKN59_007392 [Abortiporus biennis]